MRAMILMVWSFLVTAACTSDRPDNGWAKAGYAGFGESIDRLVGPTAIDCGFFSLRMDKTDAAAHAAAFTCFQKAMHEKVPFKLGTFRVPIDSFTTEVVARAPDGALWFVIHDVMPDGKSPQQWNMVCESVTLERETLVLHNERCTQKSEGRLRAP